MSRAFLPLAALVLLAAPGLAAAQPPGRSEYVMLAWNDLGMHCMNRNHAVLSVLPPYNNLRAQVILRGGAASLPSLVTLGVEVAYSIPGNTYSVGKTDFWSHTQALFGVALPPNVGLTGLGLTGSLAPGAGVFAADGIPVTPFPDATPDVESAYQQALVIATSYGGGAELARSTPTIPVSVDMGCVSAGCHASETQILGSHETVAGFDPNATPILCAGCHADPALGSTGIADAGYFSFRMHDRHSFIDQQYPGVAGCYKCHPGATPKCLRGTMSQTYGLVCQDCHGDIAHVASSIESGRVPWVNEPSCASCHMPRFAENPGTLYKLSFGHGGVACEGCHNSTHAEVPSREANDNANNLALQGHAGPLLECTVCHGVEPAAAGPHGIIVTGVEDEVLAGAGPLTVTPNPMRGSCVVEARGRAGADGRMLVHDLQGRVVRLLRPVAAGPDRVRAVWDARDGSGASLPAGTYFVRWLSGEARAAAPVSLVR